MTVPLRASDPIIVNVALGERSYDILIGRGQLAVLVKPNGVMGRAYIAAIRPFRHLIVYPPLMRQIGREWQAGEAPPAQG